MFKIAYRCWKQIKKHQQKGEKKILYVQQTGEVCLNFRRWKGQTSYNWCSKVVSTHLWNTPLNWVLVSKMFYFHPYLGKWSNLTNIFQMGWNHQPVNLYHKGNPFMIGVAGWVLTRGVRYRGVLGHLPGGVFLHCFLEFTARLNTVDGWNPARKPPGM